MAAGIRGARRAVVTALAVVLLGGCGTPVDLLAGGLEPAAAVPTVAPVTTPPPPPTVPWPLTGVPTTDPVLRPALSVKVENSPDARPQTGLGQADVVWEQVVEGGISRFVAVYQSQVPAEIGPVRSTRPMDPAITAPVGGLFATSGGQAQYVDAEAEAGLQVFTFDAGDAGFYRVDTRDAPHNVHLAPQALYDAADEAHRGAPAAQFGYSGTPTATVQGTPTAAVDLELSRVATPTWTWSAPDGAWLRAEGTEPSVGADGVALRATNVVTLRVRVVATDATDPAGNPVPETLLDAEGGEALIATGGSTVVATWSKAGTGDPVVLTGPDGAPVTLAPGTTWVELVPGTGSVTTR